jgi:RND superfamily putative drug exporter
MTLLLSDLASNKALGPVGAVGVSMAMLTSLTFLPTILYALGRASFWPVMPRAGKEALTAHNKKLEKGFWHRIGNFVADKPRPIWIVTIIVLALGATGLFVLKADGVDQSQLILGKSEARDGQTVLNDHFPAGSGSPALVLTPTGLVDKVVAKLDTDKGVESVTAVATNSPSGFAPLGKDKQSILDEIRNGVEKKYAAMSEMERMYAPSVDAVVAQAYPFKDAKIKEVNSTVLLQATLVDAPDSQAAKDTIARVRDTVHSIDEQVLVGGTTAAQLDTVNESIRDRAVIIPTILVAITIILMLLLRSIIAPILLLATTVLSFAASLGIASWLFNDVLKFPGADPSVVLFGFVFLVALGIDYNIFLMTRVREESLKNGTQAGVIKGLVVTGGVITSAGIVLAATFAALSVIPILFLFQLAFIVAFGVLLDTFIVRSLLVPALIREIGSNVWWPSKLRDKK